MRTLAGVPEIVVFHAEVQATRQAEYGFRMWLYYSLLRLRTGLLVFPLALYLAPGSGSAGWELYTESLFDEELIRCRYAVISLPELAAKDWLGRSGTAGALAAAPASLITPGERSLARIKYDALLRAATEGVNEAQQLVLTTIIETFLPLRAPEDAAEFDKLVAESRVAQELQLLTSPYELRGMEKGMQQGIVAGQPAMVIRLLANRFTDLPEAVVQRVQTLTEPERLTAFFDRAVNATSIDDLAV